jgi:acetylornithine deacetylase
VPPHIAPRLESDRLYGRGACDAKGIAAAMLAAADRLVKSGENRIDLLFVVGEEQGSDGARAANNLAATSRFLVNGEPTESRLASGAKGSLRVTVRTRGKEAHSAYPHLGESAIDPLLELLPTLRDLPLPSDEVLGKTTVNVGLIKGGTGANIIPAQAEAEMMIRLVSDVEPMKKMIRDWAKGRAKVEFGSHIPAQKFHLVEGFEVAPVAYTSDIPLLSRWGTPLLFGPGSIHVAHTPDEFIDVNELRASVDAYERIARGLLS